jgi:hypothetical protein
MFFLKNKKFLTSVVSLTLLFILIIPVLTNAALVNCGTTTSNPCKFTDFIALINGIINWIISIAGVIFAVSFIYGGFLYMTSGEKPANKEKAKSLLWNTLIGFVIILVSWLIVYTILNSLVPAGTEGNSIFKFLGGR